MNTGMLWFDNDPKTSLSAKIDRAVDYYKNKYGREPNLCLINPKMVPTDEADKMLVRSKKITVRPYRPVLPGHMLIGVEDKA